MALNEQAVLAELGRLYLVVRELEQALVSARAEQDIPATEPAPPDPAAEYLAVHE